MPLALARLLHHLHRRPDPAPDAALLERFARHRDEAAFTALLARHGPMVYRTCRRALADPDAAEDAFQATFLILARRADAVRRPAALAGWLHGVALRVAVKARKLGARRRQRQAVAETVEPSDCRPDPLSELTARELLAALDEEVRRLPEAYRLAVLLCCLEGLSQDEAARRIGCTPGSLRGRLERGRKRLHARLAKRGLTLPAALTAVEVARGAVGVPSALTAATARAVLTGGSAPAEAGGVTAAAAALAQPGAVWGRLTFIALLAVGAVALSAALVAHPRPSEQPPVEAKPPAEVKRARTDRHGDPLPPGALARLGTVRLRHGSPVWSFAFAPDGKTLASAADDAVRIWDAATGKEVRRLGRGAHCLAFAPDGRLLATADHDGMIRLWDAPTGRLSRQLRREETEFYSVVFAPDGKTLAAGGRSSSIFLDEVATGKRLQQLRVPGRLASVAFAPGGRLLASATTGGLVQVWDLTTRQEVPQFRGGKVAGVRVAFSPDGRTLAAAPVSGGFGLWETATGTEIRRFEKAYGDVTFSPDGKTLAAPDLGAVRLWEAATGKPVAELPWGQRPPARVRFSPDGKYLAAGGSGGPAITVWEVATRREVSPLPTHRQPIWAVAFAPDRRTLAAVGRGDGSPGTVSLWRVATGQELRRLAGPDVRAPAVLFSAAGREVIAGPESDGAVRRWTVETGKELPGISGGLRKPMRALAVSPDGTTLAVSTADGAIHLYERQSGKKLRTLEVVGHAGWVLALSPGGRVLAYGDGAGVVRLVDAASGKVLGQCRHDAVLAMAFSPDGSLLATGGTGPIRLWQARTGKEVATLPGHGEPGQTTAVVFSADGRSLASSGYDATVRVWEVATRGRRHLFRPPAPAYCLAFSQDGAVLASGHFDTTVLVWDLAAGSEAPAR